MKKIFICLFAAIAVQVSAQSTNDVSVEFNWCFPTSSTVPAEVCIEQGGIYKWFDYDINIATCTAGEVIERVHVSENDCGEDETTTLQLTVTKCSPEGAIPSMFTVGKNDDGSLRKVYFSKGNLQYRATSDGTAYNATTHPDGLKHEVAGGGYAQGEWRFATNQYDFIGGKEESGYYGIVNDAQGSRCTNSQASATYQRWIDIFHFGNSGCDANSAPWRMYASVTNTNLDANHDWGQYNAISNGGNEPGMWRVLSQEEWDYILNRRDDALSKRGGAYITGTGTIYTNIYGMVLLPDNFVYPTSVTSTLKDFNKSGYNSYDLYSNNSYTLSQWNDMQANGAVFIPCCIARTGSGGYYSQYSFYYVYSWSSTSYDQNNSYSLLVAKNQSGASSTNQMKTDQGCPVRLVADVQ